MTTWHPDTCECVIEYDNDTFTVKTVHNKCPAHNGVTDDELYNVAYGDNFTKSTIYNSFIEEFPEHTEEIPQEGSGIARRASSIEELNQLSVEHLTLTNQPVPRQLKKDVKMIYVFTGKDDQRHLQVKFVGANIPQQKKDEWQNKLVGKIKHDRLKVI